MYSRSSKYYNSPFHQPQQRTSPSPVSSSSFNNLMIAHRDRDHSPRYRQSDHMNLNDQRIQRQHCQRQHYQNHPKSPLVRQTTSVSNHSVGKTSNTTTKYTSQQVSKMIKSYVQPKLYFLNNELQQKQHMISQLNRQLDENDAKLQKLQAYVEEILIERQQNNRQLKYGNPSVQQQAITGMIQQAIVAMTQQQWKSLQQQILSMKTTILAHYKANEENIFLKVNEQAKQLKITVQEYIQKTRQRNNSYWLKIKQALNRLNSKINKADEMVTKSYKDIQSYVNGGKGNNADVVSSSTQMTSQMNKAKMVVRKLIQMKLSVSNIYTNYETLLKLQGNYCRKLVQGQGEELTSPSLETALVFKKKSNNDKYVIDMPPSGQNGCNNFHQQQQPNALFSQEQIHKGGQTFSLFTTNKNKHNNKDKNLRNKNREKQQHSDSYFQQQQLSASQLIQKQMDDINESQSVFENHDDDKGWHINNFYKNEKGRQDFNCNNSNKKDTESLEYSRDQQHQHQQSSNENCITITPKPFKKSGKVVEFNHNKQQPAVEVNSSPYSLSKQQSNNNASQQPKYYIPNISKPLNQPNPKTIPTPTPTTTNSPSQVKQAYSPSLTTSSFGGGNSRLKSSNDESCLALGLSCLNSTNPLNSISRQQLINSAHSSSGGSVPYALGGHNKASRSSSNSVSRSQKNTSFINLSIEHRKEMMTGIAERLEELCQSKKLQKPLKVTLDQINYLKNAQGNYLFDLKGNMFKVDHADLENLQGRGLLELG